MKRIFSGAKQPAAGASLFAGFRADMGEVTLRQLQRWMKSQIRPGARAPEPEAAAVSFHPQRGMPGRERLSVYAGGYLARVHESLAEAYEALRHIVGKRAFSEVAQAYARAHPSRDYNLSLVGRHLPDFLASAPITQRLPFLPDLARLEWAICRAFHAFEEPPLEPSALSSLPLEQWERARLIFQPSVGVVSSAWPIRDLWEARTKPRETIDIDLSGRPQRVLVFRQGVLVRCELITERQGALLQGLLGGRSLGVLCRELAEVGEKEPPPLTEWFSRWMGDGLIVRCEEAM